MQFFPSHTSFYSAVITAVFLLGCMKGLHGQVPPDSTGISGAGGKAKGISLPVDTVQKAVTPEVAADTLTENKKQKAPKYHSPQKSTWMSAALPGLGQIYNRRYWKPPIIYAGLAVSLYFLIDNQNKFIIARNSLRGRLNVPGFEVHPKYESFSADQIQSDRDFYRNNRDYSIIGLTAVYALNIVDAVVDAHLKSFDVGEDLSLRVKPSWHWNAQNPTQGMALLPGIGMRLTF